MKLYITRHGRTRWNEEGKICGQTDIPLMEEGLRQAEMLAEEAAGKGIDLIITSPLTRAVQTAKIVAHACGDIPVVVDERLIEQNFGVYEGEQFQTPAFQENRTQFAYRYPGGESALQVAARTYALLDEIKRKYPDKCVLLVSHGFACRVLHTYFTDITNEEFSRFSLPNCKMLEYEL